MKDRIQKESEELQLHHYKKAVDMFQTNHSNPTPAMLDQIAAMEKTVSAKYRLKSAVLMFPT